MPNKLAAREALTSTAATLNTTPSPADAMAGGSSATINAQVAELVDAQVSGTCGRKVVEVRVFSWAPVEQIPIQLGWANLSHFF